MTKIIVEFEIDNTKVGIGYFKNRIKADFETFDGHGTPQITPTNMIVPPYTKYWNESSSKKVIRLC